MFQGKLWKNCASVLVFILSIINNHNMQQKLISMQFVTILNTICFGVTIHFWLLLLDE